jgi:hypothetical protein
MPKLNERAKLEHPTGPILHIISRGFQKRWAKLSGQFLYPTIEIHGTSER